MLPIVATDQFSGPLDLLLERAERGKVEVTAISLAQITHDYLARLATLENQLSADSVSQFAQLGARLLYIKSLALLPDPAVLEQAGELSLLNQELLEYQSVKRQAALLGSLAKQHTWPRPATAVPVQPNPRPHTSVRLTDLVQAYSALCKRLAAQIAPETRLKPQPSLQMVTDLLWQRLQQRRMSFQDALGHQASHQDIIVTFLAALELIRRQSVIASQPHQFGDITLEAAHV
jgi:segregation and condensation protein A